MENPSNIGFPCDAHAPRPDPTFASRPLKSFLGCYVKAAFEGRRSNGSVTFEHMWVKVTKIEKGMLSGTLDNDPILIMNIKCGDRVLVSRNDIEAVLEDS